MGNLLAAIKAAGGSVAPAGKGGKAVAPVLTGYEAQAERWLDAKDKVDTAEAELDLARADLTGPALVLWFEAAQGLAKPPGGVAIAGNGSGRVIGVTFAAKWAARNGVDALPSDLVGEAVSFTIDGGSIPAGKADEFVARLLALAADVGAPDAVKIKAAPAPVSDFNVRRHTALTPAQNLALEAAGLGTQIRMAVK